MPDASGGELIHTRDRYLINLLHLQKLYDLVLPLTLKNCLGGIKLMNSMMKGVAFVRRLAGAALVPALMTIAASSSALAQSIPTGRYECWYFSRPLPGLNFTLMPGGRYVDAEGKSGTYSVSGGGISFRGAALDGQRGVYRPGPPPTIGIMGTGGRETESCQLVR